ncbi:helix-turn-helix domain-containing protein [Yinghuangia sp. ASG 101]|uniref:helix-turn-helix domain-containing protein n=1 Tax=Yinghuangia sp. ASG 101 TaxID=2896848 RepID=UPI001E3D6FA8|nr:helix-turn-helix domain-containing protein [Yinghuangia sp. ASG 101]UGQ13326.1 helix-turn-helix domain-containing protein [Yinghuangia sp. ASG 101]
MAPLSVIGSARTRSADLVAALLDGAGPSGTSTSPPRPAASPTPARPQRPHRTPELPEDTRYAVLASAGPATGIDRNSDLAWRGHIVAATLELAHPMRLVWHAGCAVVLLGDAPLDDLVRALDPPSGTRVGVSPAVTGPAALGRARALAEQALRAAAPDTPVSVLEERLPAALVADNPALAALLLARALGPVLELPPVDRDSLLSTLRVWLESGGSTRRAGDRLFYHPNTILNRLRRYEHLTGRLLGDPFTVVELTLALEAHRLTTTD